MNVEKVFNELYKKGQSYGFDIEVGQSGQSESQYLTFSKPYHMTTDGTVMSWISMTIRISNHHRNCLGRYNDVHTYINLTNEVFLPNVYYDMEDFANIETIITDDEVEDCEALVNVFDYT